METASDLGGLSQNPRTRGANEHLHRLARRGLVAGLVRLCPIPHRLPSPKMARRRLNRILPTCPASAGLFFARVPPDQNQERNPQEKVYKPLHMLAQWDTQPRLARGFDVPAGGRPGDCVNRVAGEGKNKKALMYPDGEGDRTRSARETNILPLFIL